MTNLTPTSRPSTVHAAPTQSGPLVVAQLTGQLTQQGRQGVTKLGRAFRNRHEARPGFTARLRATPTQPALLIFNPDHQPFPENAREELKIYAVTGKMPGYARTRNKWQEFGVARLRPDRLAYEVLFDAFPPLSDDGDFVFSLFEREIGDTDHKDTKLVNDLFLQALESDLMGKA